MKNWRTPQEKKPDFKKKYDPYPTTRFFDQAAFIGNPCVCCFIIETSEGLILIDCMWPGEEHLDMIHEGIKVLGYEMKDLKVILLTHGHPDHYGSADVLRAESGAKIYMSKIDYDFARGPQKGPFDPMSFEVDGFLEDGQDVTLGDMTVHCVWTPGHTPGCMSFIIPVTDEGRKHNLALWGGTGLLLESDKQVYLESVEKFAAVCDQYGVDAEVSNHPFVDNGIERLEVIRNICNGVANPFVIGRDAYKRYEDKFRQMCIEAMKADHR